MSAPRSAIVVGGGLVGLLTAAELLQRGLHVTVLDSGEFARQASWAGGGILSPLAPWQEPEAITKLAALSMPRTQAWVEQFTADHGPDCELWTCGMRIMSPPQEAIQWAKRTRTTVVQEQSSLFLPDVAQLRTPRYGRAVVAWLDAHGADLCT
ncbi:FAD-dependent oxidoreductase, partial [bacterium]|nr:FAD-dependent oxidoreductase [bacterium]